MWVPPKIKDPALRQASTRKSVAYFGTVSLRTGTSVRSLCDTFNATTFETFLKTLLRHRAALTLLFLLRYNPQLALVERVWKLARRITTHNRFFATLDDVLTAVSKCIDRWRKPNSVLRRDYAA
jgi:hypothetical protein